MVHRNFLKVMQKEPQKLFHGRIKILHRFSSQSQINIITAYIEILNSENAPENWIL